jgi:hypothetical protein
MEFVPSRRAMTRKDRPLLRAIKRLDREYERTMAKPVGQASPCATGPKAGIVRP